MAADQSIKKEYETSKPQGFRGRNSDNSRLRSVPGWVLRTSLERGIEITTRWTRGQLQVRRDVSA